MASLIKDTTNFSDKYTTFDLAQKTIAEGVAFDLVLKDGDGNALPGVQVGLWEEGAFKALEGKTTDEEGKVSLSFETAGKYYVTASGSVQGSPIVAPGCAVTVKKVGELRFDAQPGTKPYTTIVGEKVPFASQFSPRYYEGESWTSATPITRKWYRIGANSAVPEEVSNISAALTEADIGTWQYYMYAECDAYGVKLTARSNFATLVVTEPTPIAGNASHGYITEPELHEPQHRSVNPNFKLEAGKTDYAIYSLDNNVSGELLCVPSAFGQAACGTARAQNGIQQSDKRPWTTRRSPRLAPIPPPFPCRDYNTTGTHPTSSPSSSARSMTATRTAISIRAGRIRSGKYRCL